MMMVLTCLGGRHDLAMVFTAAVVGLLAAVAAFSVYPRLVRSTGASRLVWLGLTASCTGVSVWTTHFLAMIAFETGLPTAYEPVTTLASLLLAVGGAGVAFSLAANRREVETVMAAGIVLGLGISGMHYLGVLGYVTPARVSWTHSFVAASVLLAIGFCIASLWVAGQGDSLRRRFAAAGLFSLGVVSLHFTGMTAMTLTPDPSIGVLPGALEPTLAGGVVLSLTAVVILTALGATVIESQGSRAAMERMRRLTDATFEGIVVLRDGRVADANASFCQLSGRTLEELQGETLVGDVLTLEGAFGSGFGGEVGGGRREGWLRMREGEPTPVEVLARSLDAPDGPDAEQLSVLAVRDLRERRSAEARIRFLAEHDGLTGLPNRTALHTRLRRALESGGAAPTPVAVICIDLDHFKEANDLHGHVAGDALLAETARRLKAATPAPSFAARLGGDEFVVVQIGAEQPAGAAALANQLLEALSQPYGWDGQTLNSGASLGVALFPEDGQTADALLADADMALYRAKQAGRGCYRFFQKEMDETIRERRNLARELRHAIETDQLVLHYQPLASAASGELCGFEALVRWNHPARGVMGPVSFIPVAEECGLITQLGDWVLRRACADAASWNKPLRVAVNLSPLQLNQTNLSNIVHEVLIETGLSPKRLELEVTETALFKDFQRALDNLRRLKALGVRIAMDDFGTGFSSLSTLQSFPFDKIKVDKSFVEQIHRDERATAIVRAVLGLGRSLDIPVVAEGVETEEQMAFLRQEDCAELQGYAIGRPTPLAALGAFMPDNGIEPALLAPPPAAPAAETPSDKRAAA